MAKWIFTRPNGPWQYPTLGFTANVGDVIESAQAIDAWWEPTDPGATVTIPATPGGGIPAEPGDGYIGVWDRATNEVRFEDHVPDELLPERLSEENIASSIAGVVTSGDTTIVDYLLGLFRKNGQTQARLMGNFYRNLREYQPTAICIMGDSTVYGHDTVSSDKVAATGAAGDGSAHTASRSPSPWPSVLSTRLNTVFRNSVTVINRGFSGDTVNTAWTHWPATSGAGLTVICLGINDANGLTMAEFINGYARLIEREHDRGAAVVVMSSPKDRSANGYIRYDVYRDALRALAQAYAAPFIDGEELLSGYAADCYSDATHPNTKGYSVIGSRLAAAFIGGTFAGAKRVHSGTRFGLRPTYEYIIGTPGVGPAAQTYFGATPAESDSMTKGIGIELTTGQSIWYSFYAEDADLWVIPHYFTSGGTAFAAELDFGIEQPDNIIDAIVGEASSLTARAPSGLTRTSSAAYSTLSTPALVDMFRVSGAGWHTLKLTRTGGNSNAIIQGVEFLGDRLKRLAFTA